MWWRVTTWLLWLTPFAAMTASSLPAAASAAAAAPCARLGAWSLLAGAASANCTSVVCTSECAAVLPECAVAVTRVPCAKTSFDKLLLLFSTSGSGSAAIGKGGWKRRLVRVKVAQLTQHGAGLTAALQHDC
jgi:hypothetical protein